MVLVEFGGRVGLLSPFIPQLLSPLIPQLLYVFK